MTASSGSPHAHDVTVVGGGPIGSTLVTDAEAAATVLTVKRESGRRARLLEAAAWNPAAATTADLGAPGLSAQTEMACVGSPIKDA